MTPAHSVEMRHLLATISENTNKPRSMLVKRILIHGLCPPEQVAMAFMYPASFGLNSLLCELTPKTAWRQFIRLASSSGKNSTA